VIVAVQLCLGLWLPTTPLSSSEAEGEGGADGTSCVRQCTPSPMGPVGPRHQLDVRPPATQALAAWQQGGSYGWGYHLPRRAATSTSNSRRIPTPDQGSGSSEVSGAAPEPNCPRTLGRTHSFPAPLSSESLALPRWYYCTPGRGETPRIHREETATNRGG
jgi:hypothetical protein